MRTANCKLPTVNYFCRMALSSLLHRFNEPETLKMARLGRELRSKGFDIVDLSLGEPDFDTPQHIKDAAKKAEAAEKAALKARLDAVDQFIVEKRTKLTQDMLDGKNIRGIIRYTDADR